MSDEIAIASLLMAILAIIYGTWYPEIMKAINLNVPDHDKMENYNIAKQTFRGKCFSRHHLPTHYHSHHFAFYKCIHARWDKRL